MAVVFMDGFDHYGTQAQFLRKWSYNSNNTVTFATGRFSVGQGMLPPLSNYVLRYLGANNATWFVGFAFKVGGLPNSLATIAGLDEVAVGLQISLIVSAAGQLQLYRGDGVTLLATTGSVISAATWYSIEWKGTISNSISSNSNIVKLNGAEVLNLTATTDTQQNTNAFANGIRLYNEATTTFDDFYILDTSGATANDFIGEKRIRSLFPNGNGNYSQWLGSDGNNTDNYLLVDDTTSPDDDTTYVEEGTTTEKDTYTFENTVADMHDITAVQHNILTRKDNADYRNIKHITRISSTDYEGSAYSIPDSYVYFWNILHQNPNTAAAWTTSELDGAEFGVKLES